MKVTIEGLWAPGKEILEVVYECKAVIHLLDHNRVNRGTYVVTEFNDVPIVIGTRSNISCIMQDFKYNSNCIDNNRQDLVDKLIAEREKELQDNPG